MTCIEVCDSWECALCTCSSYYYDFLSVDFLASPHSPDVREPEVRTFFCSPGIWSSHHNKLVTSIEVGDSRELCFVCLVLRTMMILYLRLNERCVSWESTYLFVLVFLSEASEVCLKFLFFQRFSESLFLASSLLSIKGWASQREIPLKTAYTVILFGRLLQSPEFHASDLTWLTTKGVPKVQTETTLFQIVEFFGNYAKVLRVKSISVLVQILWSLASALQLWPPVALQYWCFLCLSSWCSA